MAIHLAEMLLASKLHGRSDTFRRKHPFSEDIESTNAILFNPRYNKRRKITAYRKWLEMNQPCVFGRVAAKNQNVFICLLEEDQIVRMRRGDDDLRDTIQDYRQAWKRYALEGLTSSFVIVISSKSLIDKEPGDELKDICRRLLELYMEMDRIDDDTIHTQREYVFLRRQGADAEVELLKFSTLPNVFCAQGDGRWWHDHRTPGGIMTTSNALGHFVHSRVGAAGLQEKDKVWALENAMRTIHNAHHGRKKSGKARGSALCPATRLVPLAEGEVSPLRDSSEFRKFSPDHYEGYFHTDHLIPSVFFTAKADEKQIKLYDNLTFRYIFDPEEEPVDHAELMTGVNATWYDVRRNMDRLPDFVNPEKKLDFSAVARGRLANWLEGRLNERLG
ncbi:MAG: hypothetical protein AABN34_03285 [Acidobacteriota bacterium]